MCRGGFDISTSLLERIWKLGYVAITLDGPEAQLEEFIPRNLDLLIL